MVRYGIVPYTASAALVLLKHMYNKHICLDKRTLFAAIIMFKALSFCLENAQSHGIVPKYLSSLIVSRCVQSNVGGRQAGPEGPDKYLPT